MFLVNVHTYSNSTVYLLSTTINELKVFKTVSLSCPKLISKIKMGFSCIEKRFSLTVNHSSWVIKYHFSINFCLLDVSYQHISAQSFCQTRSILKLFPFAIFYSKREGILVILEIIARKRHFRKDYDIDAVLWTVELELFIKAFDILCLFLEDWVNLAKDSSYRPALLHWLIRMIFYIHLSQF